MRIAIIGATGYVGSAIVQEALERGHAVTAIVRHVEKLPSHPHLTAEVKEMLKVEPGIEWTFLSPAHMLVPGERTGTFRLGLDDMLIGPDGESRISLADYAVAMIDELERPRHTGRRFTVGY